MLATNIDKSKLNRFCFLVVPRSSMTEKSPKDSSWGNSVKMTKITPLYFLQ